MHFWADLRLAARSLLRRPAFGGVVVLTIALGVAANASIFSVVHAVLLEPLPVQEPDRLVRPDVRMSGGGGFLISTSIPNFKDWRERNRTLALFGLNATRSYTLTGGDRPEIVGARLVLGDFFETLGVAPARGRYITAAESDRGAPAIAVVSDRFAARRLDSSTDPIGQVITLDGLPFTIIGVMPREFTYPSPETDVFLPMGYFANTMCWETRGCSQGSWAVGRLRDGVSLEMAQQDLDRVWREINELEGAEQSKPELHMLVERTVGRTRTPLLVLMGAVVFVLLIACANVASLVLARGESRRRELAVRAAVGASRGRVISVLMAESVVLAAVGGATGLALTWGGIQLLVPLVGDQLPQLTAERIGINLPVALFALGAAMLSGLVFGLMPAWRSAAAANSDLKNGTRAIGGGRQSLRSALVVAEVALSLVLLAGAGLMIRSVRNLQQVDKGFSGENVLTAHVPLPALRYAEKTEVLAFFDQLLERTRRLPGVATAAVANTVPLGQNSWENGIIPEGLDPGVRENFQSVQFQIVTPEYFGALGIPLLQGRLLTDSDREGGLPVAVIDESMAAQFWPGEDPIGKRVSFESPPGTPDGSPDRLYRTVVGVVKNVRHYELETPSRIQIYVAAHQSGQNFTRSMLLLVGTRADPRILAEPLRQQVAAIDGDVPFTRVQTMEGYIDAALGQTRIVGRLLTLFSGLAAGLAGLGLFSVLAYTVAQRVREIGVRVALGASTRQVVGLVAGQGMRLALTGVVIGLGAAFGLTRLLRSVLFEVQPVDAATFSATAGGLLLIALAAAVVPARRAARTDPAVVLREE